METRSSNYASVGKIPDNQRRIRLYNVDMNPYCDRVKLFLDAKEIPYEIVNVDPECPPQSLFDFSPDGRIPILELPDLPGALHESIIIVEYLDEAYPLTAMISHNAFRKAEDKLLIEKFNNIIMGLLLAVETKGSKGGRAIIETLANFEDKLKNRNSKFFSGNNPGFVDYMIWPWFERMDVVRLIDWNYYVSQRTRFPILSQWSENMWRDPIVLKNSRPLDKYYDSLKKNEV